MSQFNRLIYKIIDKLKIISNRIYLNTTKDIYDRFP